MKLFFIRTGSFGRTENLMCVSVKFVANQMTAGATYAAIEGAVSKWVNETKEGREIWEASSEDFNIGDLAVEICPGLCSYLEEEGISDIEFEQADGEQIHRYDQLLVGGVTEE